VSLSPAWLAALGIAGAIAFRRSTAAAAPLAVPHHGAAVRRSPAVPRRAVVRAVPGTRLLGSEMIPDVYATSHFALVAQRAADPEILAAARRWGGVFLPGVPVSAVLGAGVTSMGRRERGGPPDFATGLWGAEWQWVTRIASDAQTLRQLGRAIPLDRAGWDSDVDAQTYAGLRSYGGHLAAAVRGLPASLRPTQGSTWSYQLACASYSSGQGAILAMVRGVPSLASVPESGRWVSLGNAVVAAARAGQSRVGTLPIHGRWRAAHLLLRCESRIATGSLLAERAFPSDVPWYVGRLPLDLCTQLAGLV
jgi:hypothetical protein